MKKYINKIKTSIIGFSITTKRESIETKDMVYTYTKLLHKQIGGTNHPTEEEIQEAHKQLKDVGKIAALAPIVVLPGSFITIPLVIKIADKLGIDILPS